MAVAALSGVKPGMRVLDLCAAPGGKSTQLASMLDGQGLLISNEIHPARAKILSQNIERMGITNCIVTNEPPESLQRRFPLFFDTVVVDAPCSGEGMFRKEPEAIPNWSPQNVELCAERQLGILECAAEMTAPGGTLVYSTCTFAPAEDERNAAVFMARHPEFEIADLSSELGEDYMERTGLCAAVPDWALLPENPETEGGMSPETLKDKAEAVSGCIRLWPHKLEGEGHFLAVFRKSGEPFERRIPAAGPLKDKEANARWKEFCEEALSEQGKITYSVAKIVPDDDEKTLQNFREAINRRTRMIICTHASNVFGYRLPVERICALAHSYEILFCLDAAQSAGVLPIDIENDQYDFVCCAGHKYLYGPMGIGLLLIGNNNPVESLIDGGTGSESFELSMPSFYPDRLEAGTLNIPGIIGLQEGIRFVQRQGIREIYERESRLIRFLEERLKDHRRIKLYRNHDKAHRDVPVLSFTVDSADSESVAGYLSKEHGIAVRGGLHCAPMAHDHLGTLSSGTVRISPSVFTTRTDMNLLLNSLRKFS